MMLASTASSRSEKDSARAGIETARRRKTGTFDYGFITVSLGNPPDERRRARP
jgi:hypothetical protein